MTQNTYAIQLDLKHRTPTRKITVVSDDTGVQFAITLTDDGTPVDLTDVTVCAVFCSGKGTYTQDASHGLTVTDAAAGALTIALYAESIGTGAVLCEIQLYSGTNAETLVTSARFGFYCVRALSTQDDVVSDPSYPMLVAATSHAIQATNGATAAAEAAQLAASAADLAAASSHAATAAMTPLVATTDPINGTTEGLLGQLWLNTVQRSFFCCRDAERKLWNSINARMVESAASITGNAVQLGDVAYFDSTNGMAFFDGDGWRALSVDTTQSISASSTHDYLPTAKAVVDFVQAAIGTAIGGRY